VARNSIWIGKVSRAVRGRRSPTGGAGSWTVNSNTLPLNITSGEDFAIAGVALFLGKSVQLYRIGDDSFQSELYPAEYGPGGFRYRLLHGRGLGF
jgi:hypothetical protein